VSRGYGWLLPESVPARTGRGCRPPHRSGALGTNDRWELSAWSSWRTWRSHVGSAEVWSTTGIFFTISEPKESSNRGCIEGYHGATLASEC